MARPSSFVRHIAPGRRPYDYVTFREGRPVPFGPNNHDYYPPVSELGTVRPHFFKDWWLFARTLRQLHAIDNLSRNGL